MRTVVIIVLLSIALPSYHANAQETPKKQVQAILDDWVVGGRIDYEGCVKKLASLGKPAVDTLVEVIGWSNVNSRCAALEALGLIGGEKAAKALAKALDDDVPDTWYAAIAGLRHLKSKKALEPLAKALDHKYAEIRLGAAEILAERGDNSSVKPLVAALKDPEPLVRHAVAKALGRIGDKKAVKPLIDTLKDKDYETRLWAARALADIGDNEAAPHLRSLWKSDPKRPVKVVAAGGVFRFSKDDDAYKYLKEALSDENNRIRALAVEQICKTKCKGSAELVIERLDKDSEAIVRYTAASVLGDMQEKKAVGSLIARLNDNEPLVRKSAAKALEQIGDRKAVAPLIASLEDKDTDVRSAAANALQNMTGKDFGANHTKWKAWYKHEKDLSEALENLKKDGNHPLLGIAALGALKDPRGIEPLIKFLDSKPEDFDVDETKRIAVEALKDITGQDFGTDYKKWKEWHEKNKK